MDLSNIPKTFWHSLSISVIIISCTLSYTAYTAQSFTLEIANAKFKVANKALELEKLNAQLKNQAAVLEESKKLLEKQLSAAKGNKDNWAKAIKALPSVKAIEIPSEQFIKNAADLKDIQLSIERDHFEK